MEALNAAYWRIERAFPGVGPTPTADVEVIVQKVTMALRAMDWRNVTTGDVAVVLRAHMYEEQLVPEDLRRFLDAEVRATTNPRLLDVLAQAYLETWSAASPKTQQLQRQIVERSELLPRRWQNLFAACPDFLDLTAGPSLVGGRMVAAVTPYRWLREIGLAAPHGPGFMQLAHTSFLQQSPDPEDVHALEKLLAWVSPSGVQPLDDLRAAVVVDRILYPWTRRPCPADYQEQCLTRLIERFGDPRHEAPAFWSQVSEAGRRVLHRWLARKSMEAMFEVVTEAERGNSSGHQWIERRRFWMGMYETGRVDDAWVALGSNAVPIAQALARRNSDKSYLSFGRQVTRPDTCLLFMKIGAKTVVEGSHNFRVHIYPAPARQTPQLFANQYDLNEILLPSDSDYARRHVGEWKEWVLRRIGRA
ncbi:hypothetical protein EOI86_22720 [Hwanghaeella grinnelliae]|uniref:Zorya protein ZorC EH domain-containing protein n=1 Tax=Hwanghaeella grinnelliae TaxID=2500179 RepID=A0A3S2Z4Y8_9PROT|nr:EH signature domain-containing protein [Hwanghaeella grinnelliae]RVU33943.1 hypothetical protein EOI86_22720 [Hwanghaeella grinnelliae]